MNNVTFVVRGRTSDHAAFVGRAARLRAFVAEREPGTLRYECYTDSATGRFVWHEMFEDDQAALQHMKNQMETDLLERVIEVGRPETLTVLGPVENEELIATLTGVAKELDVGFEHFADPVGLAADRV